MAAASLQDLVFDSFINEINALKPGNVSRYSDGHGMVYADFYRSAELVSPILCDQQLSMGERLFQAVDLTMTQVGCNTNLGMLLLFLPIIRVYEQHTAPESWSSRLIETIAAVQEEESSLFFAGISLANPGGLGSVEKYDVTKKPSVKLLTAMQAAQEQDMIAAQYGNGYSQVLDFGVSRLDDFAQRWNSVEWAVVGCYLSYMAELNDSHIGRKFGLVTAEEIRRKAVPILAEFDNYNNPELAIDLLLEFDKELKTAHINPGTSADLTAATLLLYQLSSKQF